MSVDSIGGDPGSVQCRYCRVTSELDECDVMGACPDNVFCANCETEIVAETGEVAELCGECDDCVQFRLDGVFEKVKAEREKKREESML